MKKASLISNYDIYLYNEGTHFESYKILGAHWSVQDEFEGVNFTVWAPSAREVSVVGDFNQWQGQQHKMDHINNSGFWSIFISGLQVGSLYKYQIITLNGEVLLKADPYAFSSEYRPGTASKISSQDVYGWGDNQWQHVKTSHSIYNQPINIYEVHLGTWKRKENGDFYTYRELADELVKYVLKMGYTHIELLPLAEYPFDRSWGYQITGYYSVTSRYGSPHDFMYFVDCCHQNGIGVILDWVPGHFCKDDHGLRRFDGSALYEYADPQKAERTEWGTLSFDFGKPAVQSFLISNAIFWFDVYHIDGLRVDAVASMIYLDFAKKEGQWSPNQYGGRENLEAVALIKKLNEAVFKYFPAAMMIAEESTDWPLVSAPTYLGGLGFNFKWNMGWMNDTLKYMELDPSYRATNHNLLTFSFFYAFSENFMLPLSHDEVVYGKKSLLNKMPGDYWQKFANLRALFGYMMTHPGKKLLFMGSEFGQFDEWNDQWQLDWNLLNFDQHNKIHHYISSLNNFYRDNRALWELDYEEAGFQWIDPHNADKNVVTYMRIACVQEDFIIIICNFSPVFFENYRIGTPRPGSYIEVFNSDLAQYGGSGQQNYDVITTSENGWHGQPFSINIKLPPLAFMALKPIKE